MERDALLVRNGAARLPRAITCNERAAWWTGIAQAGGVARQVQERVGRQSAAQDVVHAASGGEGVCRGRVRMIAGP